METKWKSIKHFFMQMADQETGVVQTSDVKRLLSRKRLNFEEECEEVFKLFDYDNRGFINKPKLKVIASQLCKKTKENGATTI